MKKIKILSLVLVIAQTLAFASCQNTTESSSSSVSGDDGVSSLVSSDVSSDNVTTETSSVESEASVIPSEEPSSESELSSAADSSEQSDPVSSESISSKPEQTDDGFTLLDPLSDELLADFSNSAFVGNSIMNGFYTYGVIPEADFYTKTSLTVNTVYTETASNGTEPIMEAIDAEKCGKYYDNVFILLGINEVGWPSLSTVADRYARIVDDLKELQPYAEIYVMSVFPVTKNKSNSSDTFNMDNVNTLNGYLKDMCKEHGANYLNVSACLKNSEGYLPASISSDGIHIKKRGCEHITAYIHSLVFPFEEI